MTHIIGDLGYTSEACKSLVELIRQISKTGCLEDFVRFQDELDLAITNRDSLSDKEREIVSEIMVKDNYFKELGTGDYLYTIIEFSDYADDVIESEGFSNKFCDKELLKSICLEGLNQIEYYIREITDRAKFESDKRKDRIGELNHLTFIYPLERV